MTLHEDIKIKITEALRNKEELKLSVLRGLLSAFVNELVAKKRKPDEILGDEEAMAVVTREAKKRKDSIEQFRNGAREDLATKEESELKILETFLPEMMSEEEIRNYVLEKKDSLGITDKSKIGLLMGTIMRELKGKADGDSVKKIVDSLFN